MARPRRIEGISPGTSYVDAATQVVAVRAQEVFAHRDGVLTADDVEALHDMRVATRRLRAALELFECCFPRQAFAHALRDVKRLADALGARRDRDVQIELLEGYASASSTEERAALRAFIDRLRLEQGDANAELAEALGELEQADLEGTLERLAARATGKRR
jgi:CHAD domain-containing protein